MEITRRKTRVVPVGGLLLGGENPIRVQSMLSAPAADVAANVAQAIRLAEAGCEILRVAVPDMDAVQLIPALRAAVQIPLVADIHFDYRLALASVSAGVDKIRINPGNIGSRERVQAVADACRAAGISIRIGVNAGSLEQDLLQQYGAGSAQALVQSALRHAGLLEDCGFSDIVLSLKASSVPCMVQAYRLAAKACDYPLHLGVTEAGTRGMGIIKSAAGIGALLLDGIGDTVRVSLTDDPVHEVRAAYDILQATGVRRRGIDLVACPTCGRTKIDIVALTRELEERLADVQKNLQVAVMGCAVNGPGEARHADIGIAGGDDCALLFKKGEIIRKVPQQEIVPALLREIEEMEG